MNERWIIYLTGIKKNDDALVDAVSKEQGKPAIMASENGKHFIDRLERAVVAWVAMRVPFTFVAKPYCSFEWFKLSEYGFRCRMESRYPNDSYLHAGKWMKVEKLLHIR